MDNKQNLWVQSAHVNNYVGLWATHAFTKYTLTLFFFGMSMLKRSGSCYFSICFDLSCSPHGFRPQSLVTYSSDFTKFLSRFPKVDEFFFISFWWLMMPVVQYYMIYFLCKPRFCPSRLGPCLAFWRISFFNHHNASNCPRRGTFWAHPTN